MVPTDCTLEESNITEAKRLVRLTWPQQASAAAQLLGQQFADQIIADFAIQRPDERTFPPLLNPREGRSITAAVWQQNDNIAQSGGSYVFDNFATVTQCTDAPSDSCAQEWLNGFAQRAYRRPLTANEQARLTQVYSGVVAGGGTIQEGVRYGVYAVMSSPAYLYRTEYGDSSEMAGPLTGYEMASLLSFFLTNAPPDQPLLDAGASGALATPEGIDAEVVRLLATPEARANLQSAMLALFNLPRVLGIVVDAGVGDLTTAHKASMLTESELFLQNQLWNGQHVNDMLLTRSTMVNTTLAELYGIAPPAGATLDMFQPAQLPETRSGILTQAAFLTAVTRPDGESVVGRGLAVNAAILCNDNPGFPDTLTNIVDEAKEMFADSTEKEFAEFRATTPGCSGCHMLFDAYGVVLENYDLAGRYRTEDPQGRVIDTSFTLPEALGSTVVVNAVDLAQKVAESGRFAACLTKSMLSAALAEGAPTVTSCATQNLAAQLATTNGTFPELVRKVASSSTMTQRMAGVQ